MRLRFFSVVVKAHRARRIENRNRNTYGIVGIRPYEYIGLLVSYTVDRNLLIIVVAVFELLPFVYYVCS